MRQVTLVAVWLPLSLGPRLLADNLTVQISSPVFSSPNGDAITRAAVNDNGELAITTFGTGSERGYGSSYFRDSSGNFTHFAFPGSLGGHANAINNSGQIVGEYYATPSQHFGYIRSGSGTFVDLATQSIGDANGVNNNGVVAGDSYLRDATGNVTPISYPGSTSTTVEGINDSGQMVGEYCCVSGSTIPFIRNADGSFTNFTSLQGARFLGINDAGQVLGLSQQNVSFLLKPDGSVSPIVFFPGGVLVLGINNKGQAVGVLASGQGFIGTLVPASTLVVTTPSPLPPGAVGESYQTILYATGGSPPYNWAAISGALPNGLRVNNGSDSNGNSVGGVIGTPTAAGTSIFTVRLTDGGSSSITYNYSLTIAGALAIATASPLPQGRIGAPYSLALAGSGGTLPYFWNLASGAMLPQGLALSSSGTITGTPATAGTSTFTVNLHDRAGVVVTQSFTLTISAGLTIATAPPLPAGTVGVFYSQTLLATGGLLPYAWSLASGALPAGLTLSPAGVIAGTPTSAGISNFTVRVADSASASATQTYTIMVSPSGSLSIDTGSLPDGIVGVAYSQTFSASGGAAPFTGWTIAAGALPPGIALTTLGGVQTGLLSGVPTAAGVFAFTVQVTDSMNAVAARQFSLTIDAAAISITPGGVENSASYAGGAVSPGEFVVIFGSGLGPGTLTNLQLDSRGYVATSLAGAQVTFDGVPAPLYYVEAGQVSAIVPYAVSGKSTTQVQVSYQGQTSAAVSVPVAAVAPGIFTADSSGSGQGSIVNQDGSINSSANPAAAGSVVAVYATGEGQTNPGGVDGKPGSSPAPRPNQQVTATVAGLPAQVQYAGGVAGLVAGVLQVNVQIPPGVTGAAPIVLNIGGVSTQPNVTVAVQ